MSASPPVPPGAPHGPNPGPSKPLMHSLGEFFGHVWRGITTDPHAPHVVHRETQEEHRDTPQGKVVLRRTIIEEVVLKQQGSGE